MNDTTSVETNQDSQPNQAPSSILSSQTVSYNLKTSHGKALKVVLGQTKEVENFDKQHFQLKSKQSGKLTRQQELKYKQSVDVLRHKVSFEKQSVNKQLALWEKQYYLKHRMNAPTYDTMKADTQASFLLEPRNKKCRCTLEAMVEIMN